MNTTIYYFSGTGNSLAVAKQLADRIGNSELVPIAQVWQQDHMVTQAEQIGFVFPLYFWGLPYIVQDFVRKLDVRQAHYRFAVVTRGWPIPGGAFQQLAHELKGNGADLHAGWYVTLPDNYILWADVPPASKRQAMYQRAEQDVRQIAGQVQQQARVTVREPIAMLRPFAQRIFFSQVDTSDRRFTVSANCNSCGICQNVCPVNNITLAAGEQPQWQHRCQQCLACLHLCPQQAIEYGKATRGRARFHHPDVTMKELSAQQAAYTPMAIPAPTAVGKPGNVLRAAGIALVVLSFVLYGLLLPLPCLALSTPQKIAVSSVLIGLGEATFWIGGLILGKEIVARFKRYFNPCYWLRRKTG